MSEPAKWRTFWDGKTGPDLSDYEFDRGADPRPSEIEDLSRAEFLRFVAPKMDETVLDAGCGAGSSIVMLHTRVRRLIGVDFSPEAVARCVRRLHVSGISNAHICEGSVTRLALPDGSVDKILCMSVLHYLDDDDVRAAFAEFRRVLVMDGILILHVKNLASLYLSTLWLLKRLKMLLGRRVNLEHFRSFRWYCRELRAAGLVVEDYNSFNLFMLEGMPRKAVHFLQRLELKSYQRVPLRLAPCRRLGADLKLKARRT